jgi:hypothetical protein
MLQSNVKMPSLSLTVFRSLKLSSIKMASCSRSGKQSTVNSFPGRYMDLKPIRQAKNYPIPSEETK